ncbi:MAG: hypothetical protein KDB63_05135, partial [Nocardioidaceae bacterium]|nr:hypothetical protein [Nocardioidaceae bacterium]
TGDGKGRMDFDLPEVDNDRLRALTDPINDVITRGVTVNSIYVPVADATPESGLMRDVELWVLTDSARNEQVIDIDGVDRVVDALDAHQAWQVEHELLQRRRARRAREEIEAIAVALLRHRWAGVAGHRGLDDLAAAVAAGDLDPYRAADRLVDAPDA